MKNFLFTSESVSEGHPDKVADQISDAVLDAILEQDPNSRVACEVFTTTGLILVGGEITTSANINIKKIARETVKEIGYNNSKMGFDYETCSVLDVTGTQSPEIAKGINKTKEKEQGAGDQGMVFGFATNETPELMPMPILLAQKLAKRLTFIRKNKFDFLRPDGKTQVTIEYENNKPKRVDTVIIATQHSPDITTKELEKVLLKEVIQEIIPKNMLSNTKIYINTAGDFTIGGPKGDTGLTGRKLIIDTYGGFARHGGGAFSGKDPSKVDRSGAYMARYAAKNLVAAGVADTLEIQIAYAIGKANPISIMIDTKGTEKISLQNITNITNKVFDFRPAQIIKNLDLLKPIYKNTACYGHFGRSKFSWEKLDKIKEIKSLL